MKLPAHKMLLSACSPLFRTLLKDNDCHHPIIVLRDVLYSDMEALLQFMYNGEVNVNQDQLASFLKTAESLKIQGLTDTDTEERKKERSSSKDEDEFKGYESSAPRKYLLENYQAVQPAEASNIEQKTNAIKSEIIEVADEAEKKLIAIAENENDGGETMDDDDYRDYDMFDGWC